MEGAVKFGQSSEVGLESLHVEGAPIINVAWGTGMGQVKYMQDIHICTCTNCLLLPPRLGRISTYLLYRIGSAS